MEKRIRDAGYIADKTIFRQKQEFHVEKEPKNQTIFATSTRKVKDGIICQSQMSATIKICLHTTQHYLKDNVVVLPCSTTHNVISSHRVLPFR